MAFDETAQQTRIRTKIIATLQPISLTTHSRTHSIAGDGEFGWSFGHDTHQAVGRGRPSPHTLLIDPSPFGFPLCVPFELALCPPITYKTFRAFFDPLSGQHSIALHSPTLV